MWCTLLRVYGIFEVNVCTIFAKILAISLTHFQAEISTKIKEMFGKNSWVYSRIITDSNLLDEVKANEKGHVRLARFILHVNRQHFPRNQFRFTIITVFGSELVVVMGNVIY